MEKLWTRHWPPGVDEARIRLPRAPITHFLAAHARRRPGKPALIFYGRSVSYAELDAATARFAGWLLRLGIRRGDRVALSLENSPQFAIAYYGTLRAGAVVVSLNVMLKAAELTHQLTDSGARVLVTALAGYPTVAPIRGATALETVAVTSYREFLPDAPTLPVPATLADQPRRLPDTVDLMDALRTAAPLAVPVSADPGETALIQYTSGTTGWPKGAVITHGNLTANCELRRRYGSFTAGDVVLSVLPWFHITGMESQLNAAIYLGNTVVALGRFDPDAVLAAIPRYRVSVTTLVTAINIALVNAPGFARADLRSVRAWFSGGAPVPAAVAQRWEALTGKPLLEGYGLTETTAPTHVNPHHRPKYGTIGLPLPLTEARIVSLEDGGVELPLGASGEIAVRGPQVMAGYWRNPEATRAAFRDGWLLTGDIGRVDDEGYFTVEDRKKDLIKVSGYSVFPAEVEALMYRHPGIAEVGVVGVTEPLRGEAVVAFVVRRPEAAGLVEAELLAWCRDQMAVYKAPRAIRFVDTLPRTGSGKLLRRALRDLMAPPPDRSSPP